MKIITILLSTIILANAICAMDKKLLLQNHDQEKRPIIATFENTATIAFKNISANPSAFNTAIKDHFGTLSPYGKKIVMQHTKALVKNPHFPCKKFSTLLLVNVIGLGACLANAFLNYGWCTPSTCAMRTQINNLPGCGKLLDRAGCTYNGYNVFPPVTQSPFDRCRQIDSSSSLITSTSFLTGFGGLIAGSWTTIQSILESDNNGTRQKWLLTYGALVIAKRELKKTETESVTINMDGTISIQQ
ncbi:MAG TPA: hypothetical protein VEK38_01875 [Candidatus Bathyarchaeia archaeon]|nr:hypothetical protein [Candidatus Bathyarchaeia archaeon]